MSEWINKWDEAPHDGQKVLVSYKDKVQCAKAFIINDGTFHITFLLVNWDGSTHYELDVTYWMKLPEPKKEDV